MPSIELTPSHSFLIQLAQDKRAAIVANAQNLVQQANKMIQEGDTVLRSAVEKVMLEALEALPEAQVNIQSGADGAPVALAWNDPEESSEADDAASEAEAPPVATAPVAAQVPPKFGVNGLGKPSAKSAVIQRKPKGN